MHKNKWQIESGKWQVSGTACGILKYVIFTISSTAHFRAPLITNSAFRIPH